MAEIKTSNGLVVGLILPPQTEEESKQDEPAEEPKVAVRRGRPKKK